MPEVTDIGPRFRLSGSPMAHATMPMIAITGSLRDCDIRSTGYPVHRHTLTSPTITNMVSAPGFARSTAEVAVRTRAEGRRALQQEERTRILLFFLWSE
ncbi:hypothetical protein BKH13_13420 [Actinomyces naeslundii]|uniref:Uncharacterized protein n=1 Tax=Actinomyces naeslundii TaxID=1655 RepID=A0ABX3EVI7_ACTNA|nr:hypothetical protein BKH13_13420 [Actinomyces naeslundii]OLO84818.1 hypothetical protein BKH12_05055 [Actinomyces naeslundii]OLO87695.1 hypothetical protein BKH11_02805 [Actinomyces naeslundii]OLO89555.1 hypothetical protein BKH10_10060 [Actinomyces naeslundii]OMG14684.1 hypothetical protein BKH08_00205 [Actinomyces naeslundii]